MELERGHRGHHRIQDVHNWKLNTKIKQTNTNQINDYSKLYEFYKCKANVSR